MKRRERQSLQKNDQASRGEPTEPSDELMASDDIVDVDGPELTETGKYNISNKRAICSNIA